MRTAIRDGGGAVLIWPFFRHVVRLTSPIGHEIVCDSAEGAWVEAERVAPRSEWWTDVVALADRPCVSREPPPTSMAAEANLGCRRDATTR